MIKSLNDLEFTSALGYSEYEKNGVSICYNEEFGTLIECKINGNNIGTYVPNGAASYIKLSPEEEKEIIDIINATEDKEFLCSTENNVAVFICKETKEHMAAHLDVDINHIKKTIIKMSINDSFIMETVDLGYTIGVDHCVDVTNAMETVTMEQRPNRNGLTPTTTLPGTETSKITIGICKDDDGLYTLFTAFYGIKAPREPWDCKTESERSESENFWKNHAISKREVTA